MSRRALTFTITIPIPDVGLVPTAFVRPLVKTWNVLLVWQKREDDRRHLAEMDARMRRDVGLRWEDVQREIRKPFWRA